MNASMLCINVGLFVYPGKPLSLSLFQLVYRTLFLSLVHLGQIQIKQMAQLCQELVFN